MKVFCTLFFIWLVTLSLSAQNYTRDAGLKLGNGFIGTYRQYYKENMALELFGGYLNRGMVFGGMREYFIPALTKHSDNFKLKYGYGVHTGFNYTNSYKFLNREYQYDWTFSPLFGMDGLVGLEYYFTEVPVVVSVDIQPYFEFSLNRIFEVSVFDFSFSAKYRF